MRAASLALMPDLGVTDRAAVRYRCGYGCVRCGVTIYEYRAIPPENATGAVEGALLCPPCHRLYSTEKLTLAQIRNFSAHPISRQQGFSRDHLPFSVGVPELLIGGKHPVKGTPIPISIGGEPILMFAPPRQGVGATRISVQLGDANGVLTRIIDGNEWLVRDERWQFRWLGERYSITSQDGGGRVVLRFLTRERIAVEQLSTVIGRRSIEITDSAMVIDGMRRIDAIPSNQLTGLNL